VCRAKFGTKYCINFVTKQCIKSLKLQQVRTPTDPGKKKTRVKYVLFFQKYQSTSTKNDNET